LLLCTSRRHVALFPASQASNPLAVNTARRQRTSPLGGARPGNLVS
jgi:hypothetical protein